MKCEMKRELFRKKILIAAGAAVLAAGWNLFLDSIPRGYYTESITLAELTAQAENNEKDTEEVFKQGSEEGLVKEDGNYYYYEDGELLTNSWITVGEDTYYFGRDGSASVLSCKIGGTYYVFDNSGKLMQSSSDKIVKVKTENGKTKKYFVDSEGAAISGWSDDRQYYFRENGEMVTGTAFMKGKFYAFGSGGKYSKEKTQKIRKAAKYEKPFSELKKYIGKPKKSEYLDSCYGNGKDGILTYDQFTVFTFRPLYGSEIYMGAEEKVSGKPD